MNSAMLFSQSTPDWEIEGRDWPHRDASRFVTAGGIKWHFQAYGQGPGVLLLHGTGAATHSWAALGASLSKDFRILAPDLPGHGFSAALPFSKMSLPGMSAALSTLLETIEVSPEIVVGHSAGAAILVQMITDGRISPRAMLSINGAFAPFQGVGGIVMPAMAKALCLNPFTPFLFAKGAGRRERVRKLIEGTGSEIPASSVDLYARLLRQSGHVGGALAMMANWDLGGMRQLLARLDVDVIFAAGADDKAVPPADAREAAAIAPRAEYREMPHLGHLAHEECADPFAAMVRDLRARRGAASGERFST